MDKELKKYIMTTKNDGMGAIVMPKECDYGAWYSVKDVKKLLNTRQADWVSFEDKKPKYGDVVVILLPPEQKERPFIATYDREGFIDGSMWMPLPPQPKENT